MKPKPAAFIRVGLLLIVGMLWIYQVPHVYVFKKDASFAVTPGVSRIKVELCPKFVAVVEEF